MNNYRLRESTAIQSCLMEYEPFAKLPEEYLVRTSKHIERGCHNAAIDKADERNIPKYWDDEEFIDQYSNMGYLVKMNVDITSPVLQNRPDEIKFYLITKVYNYALGQYLFNNWKNIPMLSKLNEASIQYVLEYLPTVDPEALGYMTSTEMNPKISEPIINEIKLRENEKMKVKYSTMYKCPRCFERKTTFNEVQKRRGDEGGTLQITCKECGYIWDMND